MLVRYKLERKMAKKNEEQAMINKRGRKPKTKHDLEITKEVEKDLKESTSKSARDQKESTKCLRDESQRASRESKESPRASRECKESPRRGRDSKECSRWGKDDKGSPRPLREAKDSPRSYREGKDSPRRHREAKESPRQFRESPRGSRDSPRSIKESPRRCKESPRYTKESPRDAKDDKSAMSQMKTNKSSMNTSVPVKTSPKKGKDSKEDEKLSEDFLESDKTKPLVMNTNEKESPRLTRKAKESPKSYKEDAEDFVSSKDVTDHSKDQKRDGKLSQSKDEIHKVSRDARNYPRQLKESTVSQKGKGTREYITPAIRIREPKTTNENSLINKQTEEKEFGKTTNSKPGDSTTDPIPEDQCVSHSIVTSPTDHKVVEELKPTAGEEIDNNQVEEIYSTDDLVINDAELIVHNEVEIETAPDQENDLFADDLSREDPKSPQLAVNDRPFRAAAAMAQAISEAQQEFMEIEPPPEFKRNSKGQIEVLVDKPLKPRKYTKRTKVSLSEQNSITINNSVIVNNSTDRSKENYDEETESQGSFNPSLQETTLSEAPPNNFDFEEELEESFIEKSLSCLLENIKNQYMGMIQTMQDPGFCKNIEHEIEKEKCRNEQLSKRVDQLESQIETLIQDSLGMLKSGLKELGIEATTPPEFIEKAKGIVCEHNDLQKKRFSLEAEIKKLEEEQTALLKTKETELFEQLLRQKSPHRVDLSESELLKVVQREIKECLEPSKPVSHKKLVKDVTLTKVEENESSQPPLRPENLKSHQLNDKDNYLERSVQENYTLSKVVKKKDDQKTEKEHKRKIDQSPDGSTMSVPKTIEDYESRVKNIITRELAEDRQLKSVQSIQSRLDYNWNESETGVQKNKNQDDIQGLDMRRNPCNDKDHGKDASDQSSKYDYRMNKMDNVPLNNQYSVVDHINKEIERNMRAELLPVRSKDSYSRGGSNYYNDPKGNINLIKSASVCDGIVKNLSAISTEQFMSLSVEQAIQSSQVLPPYTAASVSRLSQVIEDSVRGTYASNMPMEGLACPRNSISPKQLNSSTRIDQDYKQLYQIKPPLSANNNSMPSAMTNMEGLASRMETCLEKETHVRRGDTPDVQNCSRPTSTGSKSSLHTPDPTLHLDLDDRKRVASPVDSPVIPAKKQQVDTDMKPKDASSGKPKEKYDEARKWQDEISSGFDRLVALASEVDKRRRSIENSPVLANIPSSESSSAVYETHSQGIEEKNNETSAEDTQKIKFGESNCNTPSSMSNQFNINSGVTQQSENFAGPSQSSNQYISCQPSKVSAPGEKLPERHFKKKYFDQEYQKQQQLASMDKKPSSGVLNPNSVNCTNSGSTKSPLQEFTNQSYGSSDILSHTNYNQNRSQLTQSQAMHPTQQISNEQLQGQTSQMQNSGSGNASNLPAGQTTNSNQNIIHNNSNQSQSLSLGPIASQGTSSHVNHLTHTNAHRSGQQIHQSHMAHNHQPQQGGQGSHMGHHMQPNPHHARGPHTQKHTKYTTQKHINQNEQHYYGESYPRHNPYPPYPQNQIRQEPMGLPPGSQGHNYYSAGNYSRQGYPAHYRGRSGYMYQPPSHSTDNMHGFRK